MRKNLNVLLGFLASMIFKLSSATVKRPEASSSVFGNGRQPHSLAGYTDAVPGVRRIPPASASISSNVWSCTGETPGAFTEPRIETATAHFGDAYNNLRIANVFAQNLLSSSQSVRRQPGHIGRRPPQRHLYVAVRRRYALVVGELT